MWKFLVPVIFIINFIDPGQSTFSCGGVANAIRGCDFKCERQCPSEEMPTECSCPAKHSCKCRKGFFYDTVINKCVLFEDCTSITSSCEENEIYVRCPDNICEPLTCLELNQTIECSHSTICPGKPKCMCMQGYVRNRAGICIPWANCTEQDLTTTTGYNLTTKTESDNVSTTEECPTTTESENLTTEECPTTTESDIVTTNSPNKNCNCSRAWNRILIALWEIAPRSFEKLAQVDSTSNSLVISIIDIFNFYKAFGKFAYDKTLFEVERALYCKLKDIDCITEIIDRYFWDLLDNDLDDVEYTKNASFIYGDSNTYTLTQNFKDVMLKEFFVDPMTLNYDNVEQAMETIEGEVEERTCNEENLDLSIRNMSSIIECTSGNGLILAANILFKAKCVNKFTSTYRDTFYESPNKPVNNVKFQAKTEYCYRYYSKELKSETVLMPLASGFSLITILPDPGKSIESVTQTLNGTIMKNIIQNSKCTLVKLSLPELTKFDTSFDSKQNQILTIGNATYFNKTARFKGIVKDDKPVWVEEAYQRVVLLPEYGQASPKSGVRICKQPASAEKGNLVVVKCNRPYIFVMIKDIASQYRSGCNPLPLPIIVGINRNLTSSS